MQLSLDEYMTEWETEQFTAVSFSIFNFKPSSPMHLRARRTYDFNMYGYVHFNKV